MTGLGRSSLYNGVAAGTFPSPVAIGTRSVAWVSDEVDAWIESRIAESRQDDDAVDRRLAATLARQEQDAA